jgi:hypothetical protein
MIVPSANKSMLSFDTFSYGSKLISSFPDRKEITFWEIPTEL